MPDQLAIRARLKRIIVENLNFEGRDPDSIGDEDQLFGGGLGLDSVDALELVIALEKEYGISINGHEVSREAFASVATLAAFVETQLASDRPTPHAE